MSAKENVKPVMNGEQKLGAVVEQVDAYYALARLGGKLHVLRSRNGEVRSFPNEELAEQAVRDNAFSTAETGEQR